MAGDKGSQNGLKLYLEEFPYEKMAIEKEDKDKIDIDVNCLYDLYAPVKENEVIGSIKVNINGETLETLNIYNKEEIRKKNIKDYLFKFMEIFVNCGDISVDLILYNTV